jgi:phage major head subunit gpT-like protein
MATFYQVTDKDGSAPKLFTSESDFNKEFSGGAADIRDAQVGDGKKIVSLTFEAGTKLGKHTFGAGDTASADVAELRAIDLMAAVNSRFTPAREDAGLQKICSVLGTTEAVTDLPALMGGGEAMNEWVGPRVSNRLRTDKVTATIQKWEQTYDIERDAFEDDTLGLLAQRMAGMAENVAARRMDRVVTMYNDMEAAVHWLDGQNVVDTDHVYTTFGGWATSISNEESAEESAGQWLAAYMNFIKQFDFNGNSTLDHVPNVVLCNPDVAASAVEAFTAPFFHTGAATAGGGQSTGANYLMGKIPVENIIAHPKVTTDDGFLIKNNGIAAPVIMVTRTDVPDEFVVQTNPNTSDDVYRNDMYSFGYRGRDTLIYGHWRDVRLAVT